MLEEAACVRFVVTLRETWTLSTEEEADSLEDAARLAWENARRAPPSAWHLHERTLADIVEASEDQRLRSG
jgi:hypothetical protein